MQWLIDWFWGDIHVQNAPEPAPAPAEERAADVAAHEAPFVPVQNGQPAPQHARQPEQEAQQPQPNAGPDAPAQQHDPEVVAAAAQAGLDAEAIEDAEDLEGIFELVGLQGPVIGLFQTSTFCTILVFGTILGAVCVPYLWGKAVLSFIASPTYFLIKLPLQVASFVADLVVDSALFVGSGILWILSHAVRGVLLTMHLLPISSSYKAGSMELHAKITNAVATTLRASGGRISTLFTVAEQAEKIGWNGAFLGASVHAHGSLKVLQLETNTVLDFVRNGLWSFADTMSSGSASLIWQRTFDTLCRGTELPKSLLAGLKALQLYSQPLLQTVAGLRTGDLTFTVKSPKAPLDLSLVYWNATDRSLAVLTGYIALALLAAVYVAADTPITKSPAGQKTEKLIRDTLRQAGGVMKVILIISIEMLVFPLYCGMLIDIAFLPLFEGASMSTRLAFAARSPYLFSFVHWFLGTCYMFHFALFVGMCRKILRKGVLWFIRDPDDPTFHPVRDVLERNVTTQLRKIAFSALVYGALVILCLGGVIWSIGHVFKGIFPIHWVSTEPVLEFPMDLLLYNFMTPIVIRLFKPSDAVHVVYGWWLRKCARMLRLSHFLFDDRRKDEEGHQVHKSWSSVFMMRKADVPDTVEPKNSPAAEPDDATAVYFKRDGKYVLTPCNDQYRPPKAGEAFLYTDEDDVYIADKDGKKNDQFEKIYIPPYFRFRIALFMVCLWIFSAFTGLCATLVPLVFGRRAFAYLLPELRVNDIYAYSVGAYTLGALLYIALNGGSGVRYVRDKTPAVDFKAWIEPMRRYALQVLKCIYVYGFLGLFVPCICALLLQFYLILPLHTYASSLAETVALPQHGANTSLITNVSGSASAFVQAVVDQQNATSTTSPSIAQHSFHILQDYALGLLYVRIATRLVVTTPTSRAAEAFRRVTEDGYLNPKARLATRFFVLPALLLSAFVILFPPLTAWLSISLAQVLSMHVDDDVQTVVYRYSYPATAALGFTLLSVLELGKATSRWRARIRDEVYLVGERLHNFGEKKPPTGSKSVVRKEK